MARSKDSVDTAVDLSTTVEFDCVYPDGLSAKFSKVVSTPCTKVLGIRQIILELRETLSQLPVMATGEIGVLHINIRDTDFNSVAQASYDIQKNEFGDVTINGKLSVKLGVSFLF